MVVTMTGDVEDGSENALFASIVRDYVLPSLDGDESGPPQPDPALRGPLEAVLHEVNAGSLRIKPDTEARLIPSIEPKEHHHPFAPAVKP